MSRMEGFIGITEPFKVTISSLRLLAGVRSFPAHHVSVSEALFQKSVAIVSLQFVSSWNT